MDLPSTRPRTAGGKAKRINRKTDTLAPKKRVYAKDGQQINRHPREQATIEQKRVILAQTHTKRRNELMYELLCCLSVMASAARHGRPNHQLASLETMHTDNTGAWVINHSGPSPQNLAHFMPGQLTIDGLPPWSRVDDIDTQLHLWNLFGDGQVLLDLHNQSHTRMEEIKIKIEKVDDIKEQEVKGLKGLMALCAQRIINDPQPMPGNCVNVLRVNHVMEKLWLPYHKKAAQLALVDKRGKDQTVRPQREWDPELCDYVIKNIDAWRRFWRVSPELTEAVQSLVDEIFSTHDLTRKIQYHQADADEAKRVVAIRFKEVLGKSIDKVDVPQTLTNHVMTTVGDLIGQAQAQQIVGKTVISTVAKRIEKIKQMAEGLKEKKDAIQASQNAQDVAKILEPTVPAAGLMPDVDFQRQTVSRIERIFNKVAQATPDPLLDSDPNSPTNPPSVPCADLDPTVSSDPINPDSL